VEKLGDKNNKTFMIHPSFNKTKIAHAYYLLLGKKYDERQAGKQWAQEKNFDIPTLQLVVSKIFAEQKIKFKDLTKKS
jgi:hypothetical protein